MFVLDVLGLVHALGFEALRVGDAAHVVPRPFGVALLARLLRRDGVVDAHRGRPLWRLAPLGEQVDDWNAGSLRAGEGPCFGFVGAQLRAVDALRRGMHAPVVVCEAARCHGSAADVSPRGIG